MAFLCSCVKLLASLVYVGKGEISASDSDLLTDQGYVENVRDVAAVEYVQEDVDGKFGESTGSVWSAALRHRARGG